MVVYEHPEKAAARFAAPAASTARPGSMRSNFQRKRIKGENAMNVCDKKNLIVFGASGTGKSHKLESDRVKFFGENYERVTFYPTYSYAQFVGAYKPVMKPKANGAVGEEEIAYEFVPGPFLRVLVKALSDRDHNYCLVIEEINRANAAAVFGDVFQLLDRKDGVSEYSVAASEDVKKYLNKVLTKAAKDALCELAGSADSLKIPSNMYIWATMSSADQGVFPMDAAFKRRWAFEYIGIDDGVTDECRQWTVEGNGYNWNDFRCFINELLSAYDVNEDKLMGPYFVKADNGDIISKKLFVYNVLKYIWEDVAQMVRKNLFGENIKTYSQLIREWDNYGIKVFLEAVRQTGSDEIRYLYGKLAGE